MQMAAKNVANGTTAHVRDCQLMMSNSLMHLRTVYGCVTLAPVNPFFSLHKESFNLLQVMPLKHYKKNLRYCVFKKIAYSITS